MIDKDCLKKQINKSIMHILYQFMKSVKKIAWAIIVAYMLGIHNGYKEEEKSPDDIVLKVVEDDVQENSAPKD